MRRAVAVAREVAVRWCGRWMRWRDTQRRRVWLWGKWAQILYGRLTWVVTRKKTATYLWDALDGGFRGTAKVYAVCPPIAYDGGKTTAFMVASATVAVFDVETYLFPSDITGRVLDWCELPGSYQGGMDHAEAVAGWLRS